MCKWIKHFGRKGEPVNPQEQGGGRMRPAQQTSAPRLLTKLGCLTCRGGVDVVQGKREMNEVSRALGYGQDPIHC